MPNSEEHAPENQCLSGQIENEQTIRVEQVVADPLRFKAKLSIGEDAYTSLKTKKYLLDAIDAAGGAATGVSIAKSAAVASSFFAPTGLLGLLGIGTAVTPLGWVVAAGALSAGLTIAFNRMFRSTSGAVKVIPDFINTPLDLLATALFDMTATLGLKIASVDGVLDADELKLMETYFVKEWGYDPEFVRQALEIVQVESKRYSIREIAEKLAQFKKDNPDCNFKAMADELISFLKAISEADGYLDEREEMAIERVQAVFRDVDSFSVSKILVSGKQAAANAGSKTREKVSSIGISAKDKVSDSVETVKDWLGRVKPRRK